MTNNTYSHLDRPDFEPSIKATKDTSGKWHWEPVEVDLRNVETRHPEAYKEWKELWVERNNALSASKAGDTEGVKRADAAIAKIEKRHENLSPDERAVIGALSNREVGKEWKAEGLDPNTGRPLSPRNPPRATLKAAAPSSKDADKLVNGIMNISKDAASVDEIRDVQRILKDQGYDLGKFGPNHNGVDGVVGTHTKKAIADFMEKDLRGLPQFPKAIKMTP